ncbi:hypothetical protein C1645_817841 [Glomus cerebriforme]|uniref:Crinkler effector protein N-terminal domain-containing protein n=1 Tax=Glomus cerebriforme TaxID=658196 RepID=A0A397TIA2_9GLOM|nr:hypothetical protein C1645_817841 [Glomus cerebriforme]
MSEIRLNCLVIPNNYPVKKIIRHHVITISIDNRKSIHSLRKQIKEEHLPQFDNIPITKFVVCAIDLNSDKKEASINAESVMNSVQNKTKIGSEQFPISNILEHFSASSPTSPVSITEEISSRTMSDVVKDFNTKELIDYLGRKDLKLDEDDIKILCKEKIAGLDFFNTTKEEF